MIKVLLVYPQFNLGGTEKVIMSIFDNGDKNIYEFYFLAESIGSLDVEIIKKGGNIKYINYDDDYEKELYKLFLKEKFDIIHTHTSQSMGCVLKIAKKANIKIRIAHSHNARQDLNFLYRFCKKIKSKEIEKNANVFYACSSSAAKWLFPQKYKIANIIENAIDIEKFKYRNIVFDSDKHDEVFNNGKIIINVGRLAKQKNQKFILKIAKKMRKVDKEFKFVIVGDGPKYQELMNYKKKNNLTNVELVGSKKNIEELLSLSDIFLFPSLHEGLGIVAIEAQVNGLNVIASSNVPREADLNINLFKAISLKKSANYWCKEIIKSYNNKLNKKKRKDVYKLVYNTDYNIENGIKKVYKKGVIWKN